MAGRHRRRDHPAHALSRVASRSAPQRSASASTRSSALQVQLGARARRPASPTPTCSRDLIKRRAAADARRSAGQTLDQTFTFYFRRGDPLETNCAVADVRAGQRRDLVEPEVADLRPGDRSPQNLGLPLDSVTVHVTQGGGSFGRHLFCDAAFEAATISQGDRQAGQADVAPHRQLPAGPRPPDVHLAGAGHLPRRQRADLRPAPHQRRHRLHPRPRARSSRATLGDVPEGDFLGYSQSVFTLTANVPYNFGASPSCSTRSTTGASTPAACATSTARR